MLRIVIVVGNPRPKSRTARIAEMFATRLVAGCIAEISVIDLADHSDELFRWPSEQMAKLNDQVSQAHLAIFASPTYKASYTGLLKAFLDRYPAGGLKGVTAIALMTGADLGHSMAPSTHLVPLLLELGGSVPMRGLYFVTGDLDRVEHSVEILVDEFRATLDRLSFIERGVQLSPRLERAGAR
jgi:FMN reductase